MSTNTTSGSSRFSTVSGRLGLLSMAFVVALVVPAWLARAELGAQAETGAAINVAGRQRMLTQRIAKNAQIVFHDARNAAASEELASAANLFSSTLDDLREGDATAGIAQLTDAEQTQVRADVEAMWAPVRSAVSTLLDGSTEESGRAAALATIMGNEAQLLGRSNDLVKLIEARSNAGTGNVMAMITALLGIGFAYLVASWFVVRTGVVAPLKRAIESLARTTDISLEGAKNVSESSKSLAASVTNSAASLEETAASLEEMSSITRSNADNSAKANAIAVRTKGSSTEGAELVAELETSIQAMCDSSAEMSKIVKSIEAIAFQTNLLALNAAVEAARAGEHGKGFAVVAEEVRSLAQRAAEATRSTANLIEESHQRTTEGLDSTTRVARSLHEIRTSAEELASLVQEISSAGSEMAEGIGQINTAVTQLDQVTQANSLGAESSAESADEIYERTQGLVAIRDQLESLVGANAGSGTSFGAPNSKSGSSASKSAEKDSKKKSATVDGPGAALPAAAAGSQDELEEVLPLGGDDFEEF